jgi:hypothetical protein
MDRKNCVNRHRAVESIGERMFPIGLLSPTVERPDEIPKN